MCGDDGQIRKIAGEIVDRHGVRVTQLRSEAARESRAHSGGADIDHHGHAETGDDIKQRTQRRVVDRVVTHDRVEVEAEHVELVDRTLGLGDRRAPLQWVNRSPRLQDCVAVAIAHAGDVLVGAWRRPGHRLDIECHEHGFHARLPEVGGHLRLGLAHPVSLPVGRKRLDEWPLRGNPFGRARIAMQIDRAHHSAVVAGDHGGSAPIIAGTSAGLLSMIGTAALARPGQVIELEESRAVPPLELRRQVREDSLDEHVVADICLDETREER